MQQRDHHHYRHSPTPPPPSHPPPPHPRSSLKKDIFRKSRLEVYTIGCRSSALLNVPTIYLHGRNGKKNDGGLCLARILTALVEGLDEVGLMLKVLPPTGCDPAGSRNCDIRNSSSISYTKGGCRKPALKPVPVILATTDDSNQTRDPPHFSL